MTVTSEAREPERSARRRLALPLLGALLAALTLAACGGSSGGSDTSAAAGATDEVTQANWGVSIRDKGTPVRGGTLVVDQYRQPLTLSAWRMMEGPDTPAVQAGAQIYNQLVEYQPGAFDPQPGLARSWEVSDDGLTYTFHLENGVTFQNGDPFTSEDVKFTLDHARGDRSFFRDSLYGVIKEIQTPDDLTAVVKLSRVSPGFVYALGNIAASIVPAGLIRRIGIDAYNKKPIGTGPFMVDRWIRDQEVILKRNPNYWREGLPYLDEVRLRQTENDNTRVLNVTSGQTDVADIIPFSQIGPINRGGEADAIVGAGGDMWAIWTNNQRAPFRDVKVRQALAYATPLADINRVVFGGVATTMTSIYPKMKYWDKSVRGFEHDPEKAKALLRETDVPNGFSTTLNVVGTDQPSNQAAQIIQQAWKEIGVNVKIQRLDDATLGDEWFQGKADVTIHTPGAFATDVPVEDEFAALLFDSPVTNNLYTFARDPEAQRLTKQALVSLDEDERSRLFSELQRESLQNLPVIPMIYTPNRAAVRKNVHGFNYLMAGSMWRLERVWKG
jgi:peptide/nickel transport system substrate-binding protein